MKKLRKILSALLALIMMISIIPLSSITASAAIYSGTCGDNLTWTYNTSTYTLTISGTGAMYDYDYDYNNRPWDSYEANIKNVVINNGVTTIGDCAFYLRSSLTSVTIPNSVTTIGKYAFCDCYRLTSVTIPDSVTTIGYAAFSYCSSLTSVTIPDSVTTIGYGAFYYCTSLTSVTIGDSVTTIGEYAFYSCTSLTDVYYGGTKEQWKKISIGSNNNALINANIHFNNHTFGDWSTVTSPTCTENGFEKRICTECGKEETQVIPALGHKYNSVVTAPTCTEKGYTTYTCECGDTYVDNYVDALGHTEEIIPAVAPTCTETGLTEGTKCSVCGDILTEQKEVFANGHTSASAVEENYIAPTCTENGSKEVVIYCSVCDEELSRETEDVDATGHADNDGNGYCDDCEELLDPSVECECNCHKSGISKFFFDFILFFQRLFGANKECACGVAHY